MIARAARRLSAAVAVSALLAIPGCGDEEDAPTTAPAAPPLTSETATAEATTAGGVERYCDLQRELDRAVDEAFRDLGDSPSQEDAEAALSAFLEENDEKIADLERAAPPEIQADVALLAADARSRAGVSDEPPADPTEIQSAEQRVAEFEEGEGGCAG